ncbi:NAD(P)H-binding protein [Vibrio amylolyticus]|uniref:NAD(P)H-binding protein n=1 Tax=Vibrio amylolyticus TaxID=2847292 RepID=UPI00354EE447
MKNITIIGAGWLGTPLATSLLSQYDKVFASRRTSNKASELDSLGICGFNCNLEQPESLKHALDKQQPDVIVGCFPPGFRKGLTNEYKEMWRFVVEAAVSANVRKIIMVSSSAVYPSLNLAENSDAQSILEMVESKASHTIAQQFSSFSTNAQILLEAEQHVIDSGLEFVVLRMSGLIGPQRHPSRFVSKLKKVSRLAPANMVHLTDAIGAITYSLNSITNQVVNVTSPNTVSKETFYQHALLQANQSLSLMPEIVAIPDKRIVTDKIIKLGYQYRYPDILSALESINE